MSRHCTATGTLLQTGSVQRQGIEQCPKSFYSLNTDNTGDQGSDCWNLTTLQLKKNNKKTKKITNKKKKHTTLSKSIVFRQRQILPLLCQI